VHIRRYMHRVATNPIAAALLAGALSLHAGCGSSTSSPPARGDDAGGIDGRAAHLFDCGEATCNSETQYCSISVLGNVIYDSGLGSSTTYSCASFDGGVSMCPGGTSNATMPGECGCYESSTGEVTITSCAP